MPEVEYTRDGRLARVRLNRPDSLNAITPEMDRTLFAAWQECNADPDIWAVVLTGAGERAFCAGADVSGGTDRAGRMALGGGLTGVGGPLVTLRKPLICAVQGHVVGGGMELAMCADIIVAADTTKFSIPESKVGIMGEAGILHRAIRQLPHRIAMAMIMTGERLGAEDARSFGLVNEVVAFEAIDDAVGQWAEKVLAASPLAVQAAKAAVLSRADWPLEIALATRYEPIEAYAGTADEAEGRAAFAERRPPRWSGR